MSSSAKEATGAETEEDNSSSVVEDSVVSSSKPEEDDMPRGAKKKGSGDTSTSSTTNDPSLTSATAKVETVVASHPTSQSSGLPSFAAAAAAAAPPVPLTVKKPRRAGFRTKFLQQLRVMLDRESQNHSTIVQWSTDGNSFIITDQPQFETDIIPTYFDNPIVFASFLSKLYRWGFNRVSSRQTVYYEFRSPTFRRLGADSAPAAAAVNTCSNAGGGASIQVQHQQQQQPIQASSSLLQQVLALINQSPLPNPPPSQADAIADLITNTQCQRSSQQPSIPSQHSALNHQLNMNLNLQPFQQRQNPNSTMNLLNTALSILVGSQTPSAHQRNAIQALMSLYGMLLQTGTFPNTNASPPAMPQLNNMPVQSLLMLIHRVCEDERQRRVQADATQNAIIAYIGQILGLGSGGTASLNLPVRNPTGMTVSVPDSIAFQAHQGIPSASADGLNFQADPIAAILQAARSLEEVAPQTKIGPVDDDNNDGNDEGKDDHDGRPLSQRKRKCPEDGHGDDNSPRKKK